MNVWAIVPVKPLRDSKSRLAGIISANQRAELTGRMLSQTLQILQGVTAIQNCLVVSRDPAALKIGRQGGALTYGESEKQDLNMALTRATHIAIAQNSDCILILPSDLPFLTVEDIKILLQALPIEGDECFDEKDPLRGYRPGNGYYLRRRSMVICSDQTQDGTNALLLCGPVGFTYQYGPGSFDRHIKEAERLGIAYTIVDPPGIRFDLDTEEDWNRYQAMQEQTTLPAR